MATTEEIITRYSANEGDYVRGTEKAIGATKKLAKAVGVTQDKIARGRFTSSQGQNGFFGKFFKDLKGMKMSAVEMPGFDDFANLGRMAIGTLAGVATAAGVAGIAAMRKAGDFDALVKALEAVEGSAGKAQSALGDLSQLAKLPGIDLTDAIQAYSNLRRSNLSGDFAKQIINEFGNANAMSGGGSAEFSQVMRAVTQIANKPFLQGDELVQLMEAGVPAYQLIKQIFGTTDTEELKRQGIDSRKVLEGLVEAMRKLPHVAGSAKNDFENLGQAIEMAMVKAGTALNTALLPKLNEVTRVIDEMSAGGAIERTFQTIAEMLGNLGGDSSTEDILYDMLAELQTMAFGIQNLVLNLEQIPALIEALNPMRPFKAVRDWLMSPFENKSSESDAPSLSEMRDKFKNEAEMERDLAKKRRDQAAEKAKKEGTKEATAKAVDKIATPIELTAKSTVRMAQLQEKQLQISKSILGGSGKNDLAPVELGGLRRARRTHEDKVAEFANYFYLQGQRTAWNVFISNKRAAR